MFEIINSRAFVIIKYTVSGKDQPQMQHAELCLLCHNCAWVRMSPTLGTLSLFALSPCLQRNSVLPLLPPLPGCGQPRVPWKGLQPLLGSTQWELGLVMAWY